MNDLEHVQSAQLRDDVPDFRPGDTVKVALKNGEIAFTKV